EQRGTQGARRRTGAGGGRHRHRQRHPHAGDRRERRVLARADRRRRASRGRLPPDQRRAGPDRGRPRRIGRGRGAGHPLQWRHRHLPARHHPRCPHPQAGEDPDRLRRALQDAQLRAGRRGGDAVARGRRGLSRACHHLHPRLPRRRPTRLGEADRPRTRPPRLGSRAL
ncbi:MAG: Molybdenum cofactor biosynthesis protein MoaB, partial [uncultured Thermomicrobiales bacterium]